MTPLIRITDTGIRVASLAEIVDHIHERYKTLTGEDLALSPQTPQAQVAGVDASIWSEILEAAVQTVNANSIDHTGGVLLTQLGSILDIERIEATRSRVTATLTGVAGTGVLAGSRARTADGAIFETLDDVILSPSGVTVDMQAIVDGPIAAPAGTLTQIVTVIAGWETVTNAEDATVGIAGHTDHAYRTAYRARTGRLSTGGNAALDAALEEAGGMLRRVPENRGSADAVEQEWTLHGHSIFAIVQSGTDTDITRAIETHRGQGVGTMTAILGGAPNDTALNTVTGGTLEWNGATFASLDLSGAATPAQKAAALQTLLNGTGSTIRVTVSYIDGRYAVIFPWEPGQEPEFGDGTVETAFGLDPAAGSYPAGPFRRPRERELTVSFTASRRPGFPSDGFPQLRAVVAEVISGYGIGEQVWLNDVLRAAEGIAGTRITGLTVQYNGADVSGVDVPLDILWTLPAANLMITIA